MEWGLVKYGADCDFIGTSHLDWAETVASRFAFYEAQQNGDVREYDHSHPIPSPPLNITGPSGLLPQDSYYENGQRDHRLYGDAGFASALTALNHQPIIFNVYDQFCNQIIQFNSTLILNVTPWR